MKKGDLIFVYGTLRRGERADLTKQFYAYGVDFLSTDKINGELFHLGSFPGVKLPGADGIWDEAMPTVNGEVFRIRDTSIIALLDAYEGYRVDAPKTGLYDRTQVESERGRKVWVYTYNHPCISEQRIASGDWCKNKDMPISTRKLRA